MAIQCRFYCTQSHTIDTLCHTTDCSTDDDWSSSRFVTLPSHHFHVCNWLHSLKLGCHRFYCPPIRVSNFPKMYWLRSKSGDPAELLQLVFVRRRKMNRSKQWEIVVIVWAHHVFTYAINNFIFAPCVFHCARIHTFVSAHAITYKKCTIFGDSFACIRFHCLALHAPNCHRWRHSNLTTCCCHFFFCFNQINTTKWLHWIQHAWSISNPKSLTWQHDLSFPWCL